MNDAPMQTILQQRDARPVSGEHLEVLGKAAATSWTLGKHASLNDAIVDTIRGERLSPEQVRRVVEFTNGDAYLREFRKEGAVHRVVNFDCGPASPSQVLQDLNDGGGGTISDRGTLDYAMTPSMAKRASADRDTTPLEKTASVEPAQKEASRYEDHLWEMLGGNPKGSMPFAEPLRPLEDLRHKLAGARDATASELDGLEVDYADVCDRLHGHVKQASLDGTSLGDIVRAWATVESDPVYVKVAFSMLTPRFQREQLFPSLDAIGASLEKRAMRGEVNPQHDLVTTYAEFVDVLNKLASMRVAHDELSAGADTTESLLKQGGGVLGAAKKGLSMASHGIDAASKPLAHILVGPRDAKKLAPVLATGGKAVGLLGAGLAGNAAVQSVTDRPAVQNTTRAIKSVVPGTAEYQNRRYRNMTGQ